MTRTSSGGPCVVRTPTGYGINDASGTRVATDATLLGLRAIARDNYSIDPLPALRGDMPPYSANEEAELAIPLHTDRHGRLLSEIR